MRKAINGLSALVEEAKMGQLMGPHLFVFSGRKRNTIKVLYFDRSGFALWQKRLEVDKFAWRRKQTDGVVHISTEQFQWLLDGYDVWKMRPFKELHFEQAS